MEGHKLRVGALAWSSTLLSSCSRDKTILHRDIRAQEDYVSKLVGHKAEVCGLKWSYDNRELASGGNDNKVFNNFTETDSIALTRGHFYSQSNSHFYAIIHFTAFCMESTLKSPSA